MKKKMILLSIMLCLLFTTIVIVINVNQKYQDKEIQFTSVNELYSKIGFSRSAKTLNTEYMIADFTDDECIKYINQVEFLLKISEEEYQISIPKLKVLLSNENSSSSSYSKINFNPKDVNSEGIIFSSVSENKLPAWLCVGLERYWLQRYNLKTYDAQVNVDKFLTSVKGKELPEFGDLWLVPDFINHESSDNVKSISYGFVLYLEENKQLENVVSLYLSDNEDSVEKINEQWKEFTKQSNHDNVTIDSSLYNYNNEFIINSKQAEYSFEMGMGEWNTISKCVDFMDDGISYTKDWISYIGDSKLYIKIWKDKQDGMHIGYTDYNAPYKITIYDGINGINYAAIHEATHAILSLSNNKSSYRAFEEGLSEVISWSYENEVEGSAYQHFYSVLSKIKEARYVDIEARQYLRKYEILNGKDFLKDDKLNIRAVSDTLAWMRITSTSKEDYKKTEADIYLNNYYRTENNEILRSYETCRSFVYYLLDLSTRDEFISVLNNNDRFHEVYGKSVDEMVEDWADYLGVFVEE